MTELLDRPKIGPDVTPDGLSGDGERLAPDSTGYTRGLGAVGMGVTQNRKDGPPPYELKYDLRCTRDGGAVDVTPKTPDGAPIVNNLP